MLLVIGIMPLLVVTLLFVMQTLMLYIKQAGMQKAANAAALAAANALSQIVINDSHFGYISLGDYAPVGRGTVAGDGQCLPVTGINTIIGTTRLDLLIATNSGDTSLIQTAQDECAYMRQAVSRLNAALTASISTVNPDTIDLNGLGISPQSAAQEMIDRNLAKSPGRGMLLELGYSNAGYATITPVPQPQSLSQLENEQISHNCYKASVDVPIANQDFYFAGVSKQSSLCDATAFVAADAVHPLSVVHVKITSATGAEEILPICAKVLVADAAAIPAANTCYVPPGMLVICNPVPSFPLNLSLKMLMGCTNGIGTISVSNGGDYGSDFAAGMQHGSMSTTGSYVSKAILCWLRSAKLLPRIDDAVVMFKKQLENTEKMTIYDFTPEGNSLIFHPSQSAFAEQKVSDHQTSFASKDAFGDGSNINMVCHNQVENMGISNGGNHAGQPLPGDPINWMELAAFNGGQQLDGQTGTGSKVMAVELHGSPAGCDAAGIGLDQGAISDSTATFVSSAGDALDVQPRKTYYAGGEAVYLQFANADVDEN